MRSTWFTIAAPFLSILLTREDSTYDSSSREILAFATAPDSAAEENVLYLTCFHDRSVASSGERHAWKDECCFKLWELQETFCDSNSISGPCCEKDDDDGDFFSWCRDTISSMPQVSLGSGMSVEANGDEKTSVPDPIYSLILSCNDDEQHQKDSLRSCDETFEWRQYRVTDGHEELATSKTVQSPFSQLSAPVNETSIETGVVSNLSSGGGMHRSLSHAITLAIPEDEAQNERPLQGSVVLYVFLSENVFVDVDDALDGPCYADNDGWSCQATIVTAKDTVIDIEQPGFVSPQNVVAVHIQVQGSVPSPTVVTLHLTTKIHLRYPKLTSVGSRVPVTLPAPLIHTGRFFRGEEQLQAHPKSNFCKPIRFKVAAGKEQDYIWVSAITIICSIIGSFVVLQGMSRVSKWS